MLNAYHTEAGRLKPQPPEANLSAAIWVDLFRPLPDQLERVAALGVEVPSLADMEEVEISNRFYREDGVDYMTVVVPGRAPEGGQVAGPVAFILTSTQLITVRHHVPHSFDTFPARADRSTTGSADNYRLFLGLVEEIIARQADLLEASGKALDRVASLVFAGGQALTTERLQAALVSIGQEGEILARVRLGLLSVERMLLTFSIWTEDSTGSQALRPYVKALMRDINALEVHADFLSGRVSLATDTTLGMVNLAQNVTVRIVSVVAALFLPPTLIASIYGMNFAVMPELAQTWGYPAALVLMALSAFGTWAYFKWRGWL